jgi:GNAT superfamily N-acetyltransferase
MPEALRFVEADLSRRDHEDAVLAMVDAYSRDPFGDGRPLEPGARDRLIPGLRAHPTTLVMLAFEGDLCVGAAVCFVGFSTFAARPLVNIHDLVVLRDSRKKGVGRGLLGAVERKARELGCCKLTLEVLDRNEPALRAYRAFGFERYSLQEGAGEAIFMTKPLGAAP